MPQCDVSFSKQPGSQRRSIEPQPVVQGDRPLVERTKLIPMEKVDFIDPPRDPRSQIVMNRVDIWQPVPAFFAETRLPPRARPPGEIPMQERRNGGYLRSLSYVRQQSARDPRLQNRENREQLDSLFSGPVRVVENGLPKSSATRRKSTAMSRQRDSSEEDFSSDTSIGSSRSGRSSERQRSALPLFNCKLIVTVFHTR